MNSLKRIVVITGTNRGLAQSEVSQNYHIIMTGRNLNQVKNACDDIIQSIENKKQKCIVECQQLDVSNLESRQQFCNWIEKTHKCVDVLFNNAGVVNKNLEDYSGKTKPDQENARWTFETNYFATIDLTKRILPLLKDDGKILQMSSNLGVLSIQGEKGRQFLTNPDLTENDLNIAVKKYIENAKNNDTTFFCNNAYHTSKAFLNTYTRIIAPKILKPNQSMYAVHPGWVKTDMGGESAEETIEESCPYLSKLITDLPYGRNPLSFKFIYKMKEFDF